MPITLIISGMACFDFCLCLFVQLFVELCLMFVFVCWVWFECSNKLICLLSCVWCLCLFAGFILIHTFSKQMWINKRPKQGLWLSSANDQSVLHCQSASFFAINQPIPCRNQSASSYRNQFWSTLFQNKCDINKRTAIKNCVHVGNDCFNRGQERNWAPLPTNQSISQYLAATHNQSSQSVWPCLNQSANTLPQSIKTPTTTDPSQQPQHSQPCGNGSPSTNQNEHEVKNSSLDLSSFSLIRPLFLSKGSCSSSWPTSWPDWVCNAKKFWLFKWKMFTKKSQNQMSQWVTKFFLRNCLYCWHAISREKEKFENGLRSQAGTCSGSSHSVSSRPNSCAFFSSSCACPGSTSSVMSPSALTSSGSASQMTVPSTSKFTSLKLKHSPRSSPSESNFSESSDSESSDSPSTPKFGLSMSTKNVGTVSPMTKLACGSPTHMSPGSKCPTESWALISPTSVATKLHASPSTLKLSPVPTSQSPDMKTAISVPTLSSPTSNPIPPKPTSSPKPIISNGTSVTSVSTWKNQQQQQKWRNSALNCSLWILFSLKRNWPTLMTQTVTQQLLKSAHLLLMRHKLPDSKSSQTKSLMFKSTQKRQ